MFEVIDSLCGGLSLDDKEIFDIVDEFINSK